MLCDDLPFRDVMRCGDDVAAGPLIELGTASDSAGESSLPEYKDPSPGATETDAADESIGLVTEGCVKLGDDATADIWSCATVDDVAVAIDGAVGAPG